jgi:hypothetical protein
MAERKLLVGPDPDGSTFAKAFSKSARLPTEEDRRRAMEQSFRDVIREDLHRDSAYQPPAVGAPRVAGRNGWLTEQPLVNADTDRTNKLIEGMLPAENEKRSEARRLLERLLKSAPNDPLVLAAKAALQKEQKDDAA